MLTPLGFFGGGVAANDFELISAVNLTSLTNTISFTGIPQTYKHLQIRLMAQGNSGSARTTVSALFNGVTTAVYTNNWAYALGSSAYSDTPVVNGPEMSLSSIISTNTDAYRFSPTIIDIPDYTSTTKYKNIHTFFGSFQIVGITSGLFRNTSAISSISLKGMAGSNTSFTPGSRFALYGIKG